MQIFNKELFFEDADKFLSWDCATKKQWIKRHTNQENDALIDEFLKTVAKDGDECLGCKKAKTNGNISSRISQEATTVTNAVSPSGDSSGGSDKASGQITPTKKTGVPKGPKS